MNRKEFLRNSMAAAAGITVMGSGSAFAFGRDMFFEISLAEWSLNKMLFSGELKNIDFPAFTKKNFDISAVEYVNQFFPSARDPYISDLKKRTDDEGIQNVLIMIDGEGSLGDAYTPKRKYAVERHYPWVEAAKKLDCHSIRVNAGGNGSREEVASAAVDSLRMLSEFSLEYGMNVIVENHGGYSSDGKWLSDVISRVDMKNCGTLPDLGNFRISPTEEYDKYKGVEELMPFAKGVSAKTNVFNKEGWESNIDYVKMLKIVKKAGYKGYIGIEYEGRELGEMEGIKATKKLLQTAAEQL